MFTITEARPWGSCDAEAERVMLEQRVLLVRPRAASAVWAIVDGDNGKPLGSARWRTEAPRIWWPFQRRVLAVHEQDDEPLLFTVRRAWSLLSRREVCDADGNPVGSLLGRHVQDRFGRPLAALQGDKGRAAFRSPDQRTLAELAATPDGLRISFSPDIAAEPFIKMLLLAACLVNCES